MMGTCQNCNGTGEIVEEPCPKCGGTGVNSVEENFTINWDETINNQIEINPFEWDKSYNPEKEYEMEGAYDVFIKN